MEGLVWLFLFVNQMRKFSIGFLFDLLVVVVFVLLLFYSCCKLNNQNIVGNQNSFFFVCFVLVCLCLEQLQESIIVKVI